MLIIDRIVWFLKTGIEVVIVAVIVLMAVRLIADAMDLNPFGWSSRTVRRLSDGFVIPVRGGFQIGSGHRCGHRPDGGATDRRCNGFKSIWLELAHGATT